MENILEKLFESIPKVRILRLFTQNPDAYFTFLEILERSQLRKRIARAELNKFIKIGLVKRKIARIQYEIKRKSRSWKKPAQIIAKTKKARVFYTNQDFAFLSELRSLVARATVASRKKLLSQIKNLGRVKLAIISGIFINHDKARTDLLLVGDGLKKSKLDKFLSRIESELGRSLQYTIMDTAEFKYRLDMYDRFLRDILESPHEKLINRVGV